MITNAVNPARIDPTRTKTLRDKFSRDMSRRFMKLKSYVKKLVETDDEFGLKKSATNPLVNIQKFRFLTSDQKLETFLNLLKAEMVKDILQQAQDEAWLDQYIEEGYQKGLGRAFDDVNNGAMEQELDFYKGKKSEFLRASFQTPVSKERVKLLMSRTFTDLKGLTEQMSVAMGRELVDGMIRGAGAREVAREINKKVDISRKRALRIARTETVRAHAEGALDGMEALGVTEIGVAVEWSTTEDAKVCPKCRPLEGVVMKVSEAHGLFPRHPNCRCAPIPANVGESQEKQFRSKEEVQSRIDKSIQAERKKGTLAQKKARSTWPGAELVPGRHRPRSPIKPAKTKKKAKPKQEDKKVLPKKSLKKLEEASVLPLAGVSTRFGDPGEEPTPAFAPTPTPTPTHAPAKKVKKKTPKKKKKVTPKPEQKVDVSVPSEVKDDSHTVTTVGQLTEEEIKKQKWEAKKEAWKKKNLKKVEIPLTPEQKKMSPSEAKTAEMKAKLEKFKKENEQKKKELEEKKKQVEALKKKQKLKVEKEAEWEEADFSDLVHLQVVGTYDDDPELKAILDAKAEQKKEKIKYINQIKTQKKKSLEYMSEAQIKEEQHTLWLAAGVMDESEIEEELATYVPELDPGGTTKMKLESVLKELKTGEPPENPYIGKSKVAGTKKVDQEMKKNLIKAGVSEEEAEEMASSIETIKPAPKKTALESLDEEIKQEKIEKAKAKPIEQLKKEQQEWLAYYEDPNVGLVDLEIQLKKLVDEEDPGGLLKSTLEKKIKEKKDAVAKEAKKKAEDLLPPGIKESAKKLGVSEDVIVDLTSSDVVKQSNAYHKIFAAQARTLPDGEMREKARGRDGREGEVQKLSRELAKRGSVSFDISAKVGSYAGSGYETINNGLRFNEQNALQDRVMTETNRALKQKLVAGETIVFRGLPDSVGKQMVEEAGIGGTIRVKGWSSTSTSERFARHWAERRNDDPNTMGTMLEIKARTGLAIEYTPENRISGEYEVLQHHGIHYKVHAVQERRVSYSKKPMRVIILEEVPTPADAPNFEMDIKEEKKPQKGGTIWKEQHKKYLGFGYSKKDAEEAADAALIMMGGEVPKKVKKKVKHKKKTGVKWKEFKKKWMDMGYDEDSAASFANDDVDKLNKELGL